MSASHVCECGGFCCNNRRVSDLSKVSRVKIKNITTFIFFIPQKLYRMFLTLDTLDRCPL